MKNIHIVTITDGNINSLNLTLKSIDNQKYKNYKNLIISKVKLQALGKRLKNAKRIFYYKKNSSIYEAMNLGLKKSESKYLIFLNAGDTFASKSSLQKISKIINSNNKSKSCLMLISILKNNKDYFIPRKKTFFSKDFLTHSSFIRPEIKKDLGFNVKNQVTADGLWMKNNIKKFNIKKIYSILTIFYLGGVSNLPSKRSLKMKANTGIISIIKELLKFSLLKIVGKDSFYKIIYYFKYDRVDHRKIYK
jgi:glycosyltransferase involved in cell wall biosynthesis